MAQKRMFTMKIVDSDAFLDMPLTAQCLYFHLNMRADDDGFIGNPKKIMRMIGARDDDYKLLIAKRFIIEFEDSVVVIKHWWMHNTLAKDRYHETSYLDQKNQLKIKENKSYTLEGEGIPLKKCEQNVNKMLTDCEQNVNADLGLNLDKDKDKDKNLDLLPDDKANVEPLILNDGSEWIPTKAEYSEYLRLYPNVDIISEFRRMRGWCIGNPSKRKTRKGITRFVDYWLGKEQDKPGYAKNNQQPNKSNWYDSRNIGKSESDRFNESVKESEIPF